jgi:hypothetical protein
MTRYARALALGTLALGVAATAAFPAGVGGAATAEALGALMTTSQQIIDNSIRSRDAKVSTLRVRDEPGVLRSYSTAAVDLAPGGSVGMCALAPGGRDHPAQEGAESP